MKTFLIFLQVFLCDFSYGFFTTKPFSPDQDVLFILRKRNRSFGEANNLNLENKEKLSETLFDPSKPVVFHVHGFLENQKMDHHMALS